LLYVLVLIVAPLAGIMYYGLRNGVGAITDTFSQPTSHTPSTSRS
jgi:hypothetical protein